MKAVLQHEPKPEAVAAPEVNIFETAEGYVIQAEMPGVNRDGLEILLEGSQVTLVGRPPEFASPGEVLFRESRPREFRRVFELDPAIDTGRISARMDQGVLTVSLPKSEQVKPRRIQVD